MRRFLLYILIFLVVLLAGCGQQAVSLHKQSSFKYRNTQIELTKKVKSINITADSAKLQVFCWDKPYISCEIKQIVRDNKTVEQLDKLLEKFSIETKIKENICYIIVNYRDNIENPQDIFSDIKLTIPRRINEINLNQEQGSFTVEDKFEGMVKAKVIACDTELKALYGAVYLEGDKCNFRLGSGKLSNGSEIKIKTGNIFIKTECQNKADYHFETQTGNIELAFPAQADISVDAFGTISHNQFTGVDGEIKVNAKTKIGKISVSGY